jgi:hypothetical protein
MDSCICSEGIRFLEAPERSDVGDDERTGRGKAAESQHGS